MKKHRLNGFLILKSSLKHYHVVFDRRVSWSENIRIIAWVALLSKIASLKQWLLMQCIKQSSTLRVSRKGKKLAPRIVYRYGRDDMQLRVFFQSRNQIKQIIRQLYDAHQPAS